MLTRLYSRVATINLSGDMHAIVPDLLIYLRRLNLNLKTTAEAYDNTRVRFFIGDWKDDRLKARRIFFHLMSRLGYLSELVGTVERRLIYKAVEEMGNEWSNLDRIMDARSSETRIAGCCGTCRYFRSQDPRGWAQIMANVVLYLDSVTGELDPDTYLILLCYNRIRVRLLQEIEGIQTRSGARVKFNPDKIICISEEDIPVTCPNCSRLTDDANVRSETRVRATRTFDARSQTQAREGGTHAVGTGISLKKVRETQVGSMHKGLAPAVITGFNYKPPASPAL
jgi:hypothetical protein